MFKRKRAKQTRDSQSHPKQQLQKGRAQELSDVDIEKIAGGPQGHNWSREVSDTELGKLAGGPGGIPWMRQTPGMNEQS
jgi:hypothetical protein